MSWADYYHFPVSYRRWLIKRVNQEITQAAENKNDIPAKGAHNQTADVRGLTGKTRAQVPAKLQRFT